MQILIALALGVGALAVIIEANQAHRWRRQRRFWVFAFLAVPLVAGTVIFAWGYFADPIMHNRTNFGFGPDWVCTNPGQGDPVCVKQTPAALSAPASSN
jgi:ABC-type sugar transport system permease subunit